MDKDLKEVTLIFNSYDAEALHVKYNPNHRWVYKSAMNPEDSVLFKWLVRVRFMFQLSRSNLISASTPLKTAVLLGWYHIQLSKTQIHPKALHSGSLSNSGLLYSMRKISGSFIGVYRIETTL